MVGTIRYMSPERLAGAGYGVAADVWSLGVVLIEMAARRLPFESAVSQIELHDRLEASERTNPSNSSSDRPLIWSFWLFVAS